MKTIPFGTVEFNNTGGPAGAPWQSGLYQINGSVLAGAAGGVTGYVTVNGTQRGDLFYYREGGSGWVDVPFSVVTSLNPGDVVAIKARSISSSGIIDGGGSGMSIIGYNTIDSRPAASAQQLRSTGASLDSSMKTIPFGTVEFNNTGGPAGAPWQSGLYQINGSVLAGAAGGVTGYVTVNGTQRGDLFYHRAGGGNWVDVPFSVVTSLNRGDVVAIKARSISSSGIIDGGGSGMSIIGYNTID
ncbi:MAG: hypothetical protein FJY39_13575, partial [Betaproteobacteria bacterium]|nr:hypothetical protein [Betaproteobacteria bacterium]